MYKNQKGNQGEQRHVNISLSLAYIESQYWVFRAKEC